MADAVRIKGYREFIRACDRAGKEAKKEVRGTFRKVGDIVRDEARGTDIYQASSRSATGLRTVVRTRGVSVEQTRRKTTGLRPDWGALQMERGLIPALETKEDEVIEAMDDALDRVADHFDDRP